MIQRTLFMVATCLVVMAGSLRADDNVRAVQSKLHDDGFYFGEIDGAYSSELAAALTRYQIRNGLPITGQLDIETSKALGAKPAVTKPVGADSAQSSETWRRLRKRDERSHAKANPPPKPTTQQVDSPPSEGPAATNVSGDDMSTERLRDYVGAFVLAGLDPQVGAETDFFANRVQYYDDGIIDREKIRKDLQRYDARWPERKFWLAGDLKVERQRSDRLRVTFPLRFELRNGEKHSSGKVDKTIVLELSGEDWQIVGVNERE